MTMYSVKEMFESLLRAHKELKELNEPIGKTIVKNTIETRYKAWNFFTRAYHLKDWIKKDEQLCSLEVEKFITSSVPLSVAADYCVANKHAVQGLTKTSRTGQIFQGLNTHTKIDFSTIGTVFESKQEINFGGVRYDVFDLADACTEEWEKFFKENNLNLEKLN